MQASDGKEATDSNPGAQTNDLFILKERPGKKWLAVATKVGRGGMMSFDTLTGDPINVFPMYCHLWFESPILLF